MNKERECRIFVEPWFDSIHIALWRNDEFLHSFHDFSKSNVFSENLIRKKFILHKIFFRAAKPREYSSIYINARFTFLSKTLIETLDEMWTRRGTNEWRRHSNSCARAIRQSWNILISFYLGLIYLHLSKSFEMRQEQVENAIDKTNVPFTFSFSSRLMLSRRECKPSIKNDTSRFSAYNNYYCHDTGRSFEPIFMKFTQLVRVHTWVNFKKKKKKNNRSNRTTDMGEDMPLKLVFWFSFSQYGAFWWKNFKVVLGTPFPIEKVIFIFVVQHPITWKSGHAPKNYFSQLF